MSEYNALAGRVRESIEELIFAVDRAILLKDKAFSTGDDGYWDGVALNLHGFYTGVERIFEDIARTIEISVPTGPDWHLDLLIQMSSNISEVRPAVITKDTRQCLDAYRGFRHVVRNVYTFNLRPSRLNELVSELKDCYQNVRRDLLKFNSFLEGLNNIKN